MGLLVLETYGPAGGGNPAAFRMENADISYPGAQIGNSFGSTETITVSEQDDAMHTNAIINVGRKIYAHVRNEIYVYDEDNPSADWTLIHTVTPVSADEWVKSGLFTFFIGGIPYVCGFNLSSTAGTITAFRINTLTDAADDLGEVGGLTAFTAPYIISTYNYAGRIWFTYSITGASQIGWFDPVTATVGGVAVETSPGFLNRTGAAFQAWDGDLYLVGFAGSSSNRLRVWRYNGILFEEEYIPGGEFGSTTGLAGAGTPVTTCKFAAWTYQNKLHAIVRMTSSPLGDGWYMFSLSKSVTGGVIFDTNLTAGLPTGIRAGTTVHATGQFSVYVDQEANPAGEPTIYPFFKTIATSTGNLTQYVFNGVGLAFQGTSTSATLIIPRDKAGGGERSWNPDDITLQFTSHEVIGPRQRFGFIIDNNNPTVGTHAFRLYQSTAGETPMTQCRLIDNSGGTLVGVNSVIAMVGLDSGVEYFVTWDTVYDGVAPGSNVRIVGRVTG